MARKKKTIIKIVCSQKTSSKRLILAFTDGAYAYAIIIGFGLVSLLLVRTQSQAKHVLFHTVSASQKCSLGCEVFSQLTKKRLLQ